MRCVSSSPRCRRRHHHPHPHPSPRALGCSSLFFLLFDLPCCCENSPTRVLVGARLRHRGCLPGDNHGARLSAVGLLRSPRHGQIGFMLSSRCGAGGFLVQRIFFLLFGKYARRLCTAHREAVELSTTPYTYISARRVRGSAFFRKSGHVRGLLIRYLVQPDGGNSLVVVLVLVLAI